MQDELLVNLCSNKGKINLKEFAGKEQTVKSARTNPTRRSVRFVDVPPQNSGVIIIVSSLVAKSAQVLAQTGGLKILATVKSGNIRLSLS